MTPQPMLAHKYPEHTLPFPLYVQPKLDGVRCLVYLEDDALTCMSRNGKPLHIPPCINALPDGVLGLLAEGLVLDGELYIHRAGFNTIVSLVKRAKHPDAHRLQYHIYDCFYRNPDGVAAFIPGKVEFKHRTGILQGLVGPVLSEADNHHVQIVTTLLVNTQEGMDSFHHQQMGLGYEGTILRSPTCGYVHKRCNGLLKRKDFLDAEYPIIEVLEGIGKNRGTAILRCGVVGKDGLMTSFTATAPGTYEEKGEVWRNRSFYTGCKVTIKYQELTPDGIPRFPIATGFPVDR